MVSKCRYANKFLTRHLSLNNYISTLLCIALYIYIYICIYIYIYIYIYVCVCVWYQGDKGDEVVNSDYNNDNNPFFTGSFVFFLDIIEKHLKWRYDIFTLERYDILKVKLWPNCMWGRVHFFKISLWSILDSTTSPEWSPNVWGFRSLLLFCLSLHLVSPTSSFSTKPSFVHRAAFRFHPNLSYIQLPLCYFES